MARNDAPPFERGATFFAGRTIDDSTTYQHIEGKEWVFEDTVYGTGRSVRCRVMRNVSGATLSGGRFVHPDAASAAYCRTDGYYYASGDQVAGIVDETLGTGGVPNNDLFWAVIAGPSAVRTPASGTVNLSQGGRVGPATGTSRTNADAGRLALTSPSAGSEVGLADATSSTNDVLVPVFLHARTTVGP